MKIGSTDVSKMYIGSDEISKIYLGNSVIYEASGSSDSNGFDRQDCPWQISVDGNTISLKEDYCNTELSCFNENYSATFTSLDLVWNGSDYGGYSATGSYSNKDGTVRTLSNVNTLPMHRVGVFLGFSSSISYYTYDSANYIVPTLGFFVQDGIGKIIEWHPSSDWNQDDYAFSPSYPMPLSEYIVPYVNSRSDFGITFKAGTYDGSMYKAPLVLTEDTSIAGQAMGTYAVRYNGTVGTARISQIVSEDPTAVGEDITNGRMAATITVTNHKSPTTITLSKVTGNTSNYTWTVNSTSTIAVGSSKSFDISEADSYYGEQWALSAGNASTSSEVILSFKIELDPSEPNLDMYNYVRFSESTFIAFGCHPYSNAQIMTYTDPEGNVTILQNTTGDTAANPSSYWSYIGGRPAGEAITGQLIVPVEDLANGGYLTYLGAGNLSYAQTTGDNVNSIVRLGEIKGSEDDSVAKLFACQIYSGYINIYEGHEIPNTYFDVTTVDTDGFPYALKRIYEGL